MLRNLLRTSIASLVLVCGAASAAPPPPQQFNLLVVTGALGVDEDSGNIRNRTKQKNVVFQAGDDPLTVPFLLDLDFWQIQTYAKSVPGTKCFQFVNVEGAIHVQETKKGNAKALFWFSSQFDSGPIIKYVLTLTADQWWTTEGGTTKAVFPPSFGSTVYMLATHWLMETEGKGKSRNSSCKGSGAFPSLDAPLLEVKQIPLD